MEKEYNPFSLVGKTIVVTGASSGIGRQSAIECSKAGAKVVLIGRNEVRLNETYESLCGDGHIVKVCDLTDFEHLPQVVMDIVQECGPIDGVLNAAGISTTMPLKLMSAEKLDEFFKNGENFGKYPDVYYLIKFLKKKEEKLKSGVEYLRCRFCGKIIELEEYNQHYDRCSSVEYLIAMSKKYFDKNLNREKLLSCSIAEFEKYYWEFCDKLYEVMEDGLQKHVLKNVILTHSGYAPECDLKELRKR